MNISYNLNKQEAVIFNIQGFSINDGPGIRTTVFFKGCPLRCVWCHNPEGLSAEPELCVMEAKCTHCGKCFSGCGHSECQQWGRCLHICPGGNISVVGKKINPDELAEIILRDKDILDSGEGGVTFSGGEPLLNIPFLIELIPKLCGIHTAVETCGYIDADNFSSALDYFDYFLFDLKLYDNQRHINYTGVNNDIIHGNLKLLQMSGKPHLIRIPVIPGITDDSENLMGLAELAGDSVVELLPYNVLAGAKYSNFGKTYQFKGLQTCRIDNFKKYFKKTK